MIDEARTDEGRSAAIFLIREGSRTSASPQVVQAGRETVLEYTGALEIKTSTIARVNSGAPVIIITADLVNLQGGLAKLRKSLGNSFVAASLPNKICSGLNEQELLGIDSNISICSDSALLFGDDSATYNGCYVLAWFFNDEYVFLSIAFVAADVVRKREILVTTVDDIPSAVVSAVNALYEEYPGKENIPLNFSIVYFEGGEEQAIACCQAMREEAGHNQLENAEINEAVPLSEVWAQKHSWFSAYEKNEYVLPYVTANTFWTFAAAAAIIAAGYTSFGTATSFIRYQELEKEAAGTQTKIAETTESIGNLARNNIGKYAALYGISPSAAETFALLSYSPYMQMNISAVGGQWKAAGTLPANVNLMLKLREYYGEKLEQGCSSNFAIKEDLNSGSAEITCNEI